MESAITETKEVTYFRYQAFSQPGLNSIIIEWPQYLSFPLIILVTFIIKKKQNKTETQNTIKSSWSFKVVYKVSE